MRRTCTVALLLLAAAARAQDPGPSAQPGRPGLDTPIVFRDEFGGAHLSKDKWDTFRGEVRVANGMLRVEDTDIQSRETFVHGILKGLVRSDNWPAQDEPTDSSWGFEVWGGENGQCHYAALFRADGYLDVILAQPGDDGNCFEDRAPPRQVHLPLSHWDLVRTAGPIHFALVWAPSNVSLYVTDGRLNTGKATYVGPDVPAEPLRVRVSARGEEAGRNFLVDHLRVHKLP